MPPQDRSHSEFQDRGDVEIAAGRVVAESPDPFNPETTQNMQDFISAMPPSCPLPAAVEKGYWSTVRILWETAEIEVFDDRYELYRFGQGQMAIEYFQRAPDSSVPGSLVARLTGELAKK